jgi:hypothetical protein
MRGLASPLLRSAFAIMSATGCVKLGPRADPSRFFTLTPMPSTARGTDGNPSHLDDVALGVGPIRFPGYLDRDELVTRVSDNHLIVADNDRWGEPLEDNFSRVLSQDLALLLSSERVTRFPWPSTVRPTYQVEIDVLRFEADTARRAQLLARWVLRDVATKEALSVRESRLGRSAKGRSAEESVVILSELLAEFSAEIADALRPISRRQ